jgi:neutral ceramidase
VYLAGWSKQQIDITPDGHAMHGYGQPGHRAYSVHSPLFARAVFLAEAQGAGLMFCCLDLGYVTHAMRDGICRELQARMGDAFREERLVLTCTHTHSGPGGCSHDVMYNLVTPGFLPAHVEAIVLAACSAILAAWRSAAPTELSLAEGEFAPSVPVAWNRSLAAYNRNPDAVKRAATETHLAIDRRMSVLAFRREGRVGALLSLFGVHATCVGSRQSAFDGDNKGYAAAHAERELAMAGAEGAVAIFAQATAGDVSPHYHGPGDIAQREQIKGAAEYVYAERNGRYQSERALALLAEAGVPVEGAIDSIFSYADFTAIQADPAYADGDDAAFTSEPCHGVAFFAGTRVDGPGMPAPAVFAARLAARAVKAMRLRRPGRFTPGEQACHRRIYAAQGVKDILMESGRKKVLGASLDRILLPGFSDPVVGELKRQVAQGAVRESAMVPTVLPLQIVRLGTLAIVCCPGEFTTLAGRRLRDTVAGLLALHGIRHTLLCSYCNDYMGYVTTREEYQEQAYEGGHTVFGQWTLAAFQTKFAELARELRRPGPDRRHDRTTRPAPAPAAELALRSNLPAR